MKAKCFSKADTYKHQTKQKTTTQKYFECFLKTIPVCKMETEKDKNDGTIYGENIPSSIFMFSVIYCFDFYCLYKILELSSNRNLGS